MTGTKKAILVSCIMVLSLGLGIGGVYANETREVREREGFEDIGENYFKEANAEDIVMDEEKGMSYVKNQLLISALVGTDKKVIEDIAKEVNAELVGYIELTGDFQIEFREDKSLAELEKIANYIDSFSFVSSVTLNIAIYQEPNGNLTIKRSDDISEWAKIEVEKAIENTLIPPDLQNNYKKPITRKEFSQVIVSCMEGYTGKRIVDIVEEKTGEKISLVIENNKFRDEDDLNVVAAKVLGIISGVGKGNFNPDAGITREEAATLLYRLAVYLKMDLKSIEYKFNDHKEISEWAVKPVAFVQYHNVMKGMSNHRFNPKGTYTREQAYVTIYRLFKL